MSGGGEEQETSLEFTPTWVVAVVCTVIVAVSLAAERLLHYGGKFLKKKNQKPLYEALQKIKEELMLLGFISLLLTVSQNGITKICVPRSLTLHMLPCSLEDRENEGSKTPTSHFQTSLSFSAISGTARRLFAESQLKTEAKPGYCSWKIRQWKQWEDSISKENYETQRVLGPMVTHVHQHAFIKDSALLGWLTHCRGNPKFNFHKYMIRALEDDFKKVVGISWYLWIFVVVFLLLNINGWHTYFRIAFLPFILLLAVDTKLEHVITRLAHEVAEKHAAIEGELVVQPSDDLFWFQRPHIVLFLIHFILFQNAFEIAFFFWIWVTYGFDSCIMGQVRYIVPRLIIGVFIQVLCSYSALPLYAIVTQMGTHFKKGIFHEQVQARLAGWAQKAKKKAHKADSQLGQGSSHDGDSAGIQLGSNFRIPSAPDDNTIVPSDDESN